MKPRTKFWVRFALWTAFSCVMPVAFIVWRYDLFTKVSAIQFGGWGVLAVLIIAVFAITILRYVSKSMVKWSMAKQVILGIAKVLTPLIAIYLILEGIKDSIDLFLQALGVVIVCEAIAIPINPFPEWVYEQSKGATEDAIDYFFAKRDSEGKTGKEG